MKGKLKLCTFKIYFTWHQYMYFAHHILHVYYIGADILLQDVQYLMIHDYREVRAAGSIYLNTCVDKSSSFCDCEFN
jgi:hypothetical protein